MKFREQQNSGRYKGRKMSGGEFRVQDSEFRMLSSSSRATTQSNREHRIALELIL